MKGGSSENLKQKILDAAVFLFREKGIDKVTTRELTEFVGISRSHIYHYFRDWRSLSLEAIGNFLQNDLDVVAADIAGKHPDAALQSLIMSYLPCSRDDDWVLHHSVWTLAIHDDAYAELASGIMKQWFSLIENILSAAVEQGIYEINNVPRVTRLIGAAINGYADTLSTCPSSEGCEEARQDLSCLIKLLCSAGKSGPIAELNKQ